MMLLYIALALGYLPAGARPWALLVTGRIGLGIGGVAIVIGAVAGALGLVSLLGMPASLIMLEVRAWTASLLPLAPLESPKRTGSLVEQCLSVMHPP